MPSDSSTASNTYLTEKLHICMYAQYVCLHYVFYQLPTIKTYTISDILRACSGSEHNQLPGIGKNFSAYLPGERCHLPLNTYILYYILGLQLWEPIIMSTCVMEIGAWSLQNDFDFDSGFHDVQCKHLCDCENCYLLEAFLFIF